MVLSSDKKSVITDKLNLYKLDKFKYFIKREELKGENILISTNYNLPKNDKFYFSSAILSLKTNNFIAKDTTIKIHKNIFNNTDNDPRIKGVSSQKDGGITTINKVYLQVVKKPMIVLHGRYKLMKLNMIEIKNKWIIEMLF